jgi:HD-like signal output (HDOD) protein
MTTKAAKDTNSVGVEELFLGVREFRVDARTVKSSIEQMVSCPTISGISRRAMGLANGPDTSLIEMSSFIGRDTALVTRLLKTINSAIYGFSRRISSVNEALLLLGLDTVRGLFLNLAVFDLMEETMVGLWEHSAGCAIVSRLIAKKKGIKDPEEVSIYGLLHDVGKTTLMIRYPRMYRRALDDAQSEGTSIRAVETERFGVDHAVTGSWLVKQWRLSRKLVEAIRYHHTPQLAMDARVETAIIHLADIIVRGRGFGFTGDDYVPAVDPVAWKLVGLSKSDLRDILDEMEDLLDEAEEFTR